MIEMTEKKKGLSYKKGMFIYPGVLKRLGITDVCYNVRCPICQHSKIVYTKWPNNYFCEHCGNDSISDGDFEIVLKAAKNIRIEW